MNEFTTKKGHIHAGDIERAVAREFGYRQNMIVPNVHWGLNFLYELDMLIVTSAGCLYEVEIKISKADLKAGKKKRHYHDSPRIKGLWFAVPDYLEEDALELIPERAGLLVIYKYKPTWPLRVKRVRYPKYNTKAPKITDRERIKLGKLATMRIWTLKDCLYQAQRNYRSCLKNNHR